MNIIESRGATRAAIFTLGRGEYLLESLREYFHANHINTAVVCSGIGSLDQANLHTIVSTRLPPEERFFSLEGPIEVTGLQGTVAGGEPHLHVVCRHEASGTVYVGHLENKTRVCYRIEMSLLIFEGVATTWVSHASGLVEMIESPAAS
jgi:predicted DNA-binding protein with PD1-like motif